MPLFPATTSKTWTKGRGVPRLFALRRCETGQSVLFEGSDARQISAAISHYRKQHPLDRGSRWASRTTPAGVEVMRLADHDESGAGLFD